MPRKTPVSLREFPVAGETTVKTRPAATGVSGQQRREAQLRRAGDRIPLRQPVGDAWVDLLGGGVPRAQVDVAVVAHEAGGARGDEMRLVGAAERRHHPL